MSTVAVPSVGPARRSDRLAVVDLGQDRLFTYGTLLFPEVLAALLGRVPDRPEADCAGWRAAALAERAYPGLVVAQRQTTHGKLLAGLSVDEWHLLDTFEDPRYRLRPVTTSDGTTATWAYVWTDPDDVDPHAWDPEHFARVHLPAHAVPPVAPRARAPPPVHPRASRDRAPTRPRTWPGGGRVRPEVGLPA